MEAISFLLHCFHSDEIFHYMTSSFAKEWKLLIQFYKNCTHWKILWEAQWVREGRVKCIHILKRDTLSPILVYCACATSNKFHTDLHVHLFISHLVFLSNGCWHTLLLLLLSLCVRKKFLWNKSHTSATHEHMRLSVLRAYLVVSHLYYLGVSVCSFGIMKWIIRISTPKLVKL